MNKLKYLTLIIFSIFFLTNISLSQVDADSEKLSKSEEKKLIQFILDSNKKLQKNRNVAIFLNQSLASNYLGKSLREVLGDDDFFTKDFVSSTNDYNLRQFWIEVMNIFYLTTLYRYSHFTDPNEHNIEFEQQFPKIVRNFIKRESKKITSCPVKTIDDEVEDCKPISNVAEYKKQIFLLRKISTMMRNYFKSHPPEKTRIYKLNMKNSYLYENKYINANTCKENKGDCLGVPKNSRLIITYFLFSIITGIAEVNGEYKILFFGGVD